MKMESMSKNIVKIMWDLTKNQGLARLLLNNDANPFEKEVLDTGKLIVPNGNESKIFPYPFDPEAVTEDGSFVRIYYNNGRFNSNETIAESQIHIDVVVARSLWLINNGTESQIRLYEICGRIVDMIGSRSVGSSIKLKFEFYQHLYVNTKFDAMRLICTYMTVETQ